QLAIGLAAALEPACPGLREQVLVALSYPSRRLTELIAAFTTRLGRTIGPVVIDDYHLIASNPTAETFIREVCGHIPSSVLIGSRSRPSWATARSSIYGELLELDAEELALTPDETEAVMA